MTDKRELADWHDTQATNYARAVPDAGNSKDMMLRLANYHSDTATALRDAADREDKVWAPTEAMLVAGREAVLACRGTGLRWSVAQHYLEATGEIPSWLPEWANEPGHTNKTEEAELVWLAMVNALTPQAEPAHDAHVQALTAHGLDILERASAAADKLVAATAAGASVCELCGEPMPPGEEMFRYHGYSGDCPKPPKPAEPAASVGAEVGSAAEPWRQERAAREASSADQPEGAVAWLIVGPGGGNKWIQFEPEVADCDEELVTKTPLYTRPAEVSEEMVEAGGFALFALQDALFYHTTTMKQEKWCRLDDHKRDEYRQAARAIITPALQAALVKP